MAVKRLIDIGANLTDKVFNGVYRGSQLHPNDFDHILSRAKNNFVEKIIITGGSLKDSEEAILLAKDNFSLRCTVGCHPTRCLEFNENPNEYYKKLKDLIISNPKTVVAVGECGLDYDRLEFCPKDVQKTYFDLQLKLATEVDLPLFLHCRAAHDDFLVFLKNGNFRGVVHSFDGTSEMAKRCLEMGLYIGINGCSLKNENNLEVVKSIPLNRLLIETDAPWCDIRQTHASFKYVKTHPIYRKANKWESNAMVKGRNEPANLIQVLEVVAALHNLSIDKMAEITYQNTVDLFSF